MVIKNTFSVNTYTDSYLTNFYVNWYDKLDTFIEIKSLGQVLYTQFVVQFLVAGNILLLATLAAVVLTSNTDSKINYKTQVIFNLIFKLRLS